jgi:hypothetical protein
MREAWINHRCLIKRLQAGEVDEAEEVFDAVFQSSHESAKVVHPREEPLYFPTSLIAAQFTGVLTPATVCLLGAIISIPCSAWSARSSGSES